MRSFWVLVEKLFVVSPHADDFYGLDIVQNLIDESLLDVDSPRIGSCKISHQAFIRRRSLKRIFSEDVQERFCFLAKP